MGDSESYICPRSKNSTKKETPKNRGALNQLWCLRTTLLGLLRSFAGSSFHGYLGVLKTWNPLRVVQSPYSKYRSLFLVAMICRPSTKKGGIYLGKPISFPKHTLNKAGVWSRGYSFPVFLFIIFGREQGNTPILTNRGLLIRGQH